LVMDALREVHVLMKILLLEGTIETFLVPVFFEYKLNHLRSRLCKMVYVIGRISYILNEVTIVIRSSLLWLERS